MLETKTKKVRIQFLIAVVLLAALAAYFLSFGFSQAQGDVGVLNEQIAGKKSKIEDLQKKVKELQQSVEARRSQATSLENQLAILGGQIGKTELELELAATQIEETELQIARTRAEISQAEADIAELKDKLAAFIRERYRLDQRTVLEILLTNDTVSEFFNQVETVDRLQDELKSGVSELKTLRQTLNKKIATLESKQAALERLSEELGGKRDQLASQSAVRAQLLSETRNSETRFQDLLRQAKAEQVAINAEIQSLEQIIRQRLAGQGADALARLGGSGDLIYPVPFKGITAYFHDPSYPYRHVFEHPAIDLRASMGTPLRAAASGFVARVRSPQEAGLGYSYIMLIHADGISTVYGHLSKTLVQEDQFVTQGEVIGLTGGMPGTPGAGRLTTGPHNHFEVRKNGIPVNPLNFLP